MALKSILFILWAFAGANAGSGQNVTFPQWIRGDWQNSFESNMDKFVFWTFTGDSIIMEQGMTNSQRENLLQKYAGFQSTVESNDSIFRIHFSNEMESYVYEFKLHPVSETPYDRPCLTCALVVNGVRKGGHDFLRSIVFFRTKP